jgi:ABC-2 type transport system ATP-binding protein
VLFLDEPTSGMDPVAAREFRAFVQQLRDERRTVLLATHDMVEAESVCDRVTLIDHGRIIATEAPARLASWIGRYERVDAYDVSEAALASARELPGVGQVAGQPDGSVRITTVEAGAAAVVAQHLLAAGVTRLSVTLPSLEEVYLNLIGERGMRV